MSLERYYMEGILEAGVDEAGRGPLFGRVYVGAAILPQDNAFDHSLMRDSKRLSERKRLIAYDYIRDYAVDYHVHFIEADEIDRINIYNATLAGMHGALDGLLVTPGHILVDGCAFRVYAKNRRVIPHLCVEGGDDKYTPIAAASILAKVAHDKYIEALCDEYGNLDDFYGLRRNKGYGTARHMEGIREHGLTPWHRRTFGICKTY